MDWKPTSEKFEEDAYKINRVERGASSYAMSVRHRKRRQKILDTIRQRANDTENKTPEGSDRHDD